MLRRKAFEKIDIWANHPKKLCLFIDGARQVGKTYAIREYAKKYFKNIIVLDFMKDQRAIDILSNISSFEDLLFKLRLFNKEDIDFDKTLILFDEIQRKPEIFKYAKTFVEEQKYNIAFSGSLLGVTMQDYLNEPLGNLFFIKMYPLDFEEFLWANGVNEEIISRIKDAFLKLTPLDEVIHQEILRLFKTYLIVGGMPDAILAFLKSNSNIEVNAIKETIYRGYLTDISKYSYEDKLIIQDIYNMISSELANKNRRFILKNLNQNQRFSRYESDFVWLVNAGVVLSCNNAKNPTYPLELSKERNLFKLYYSDVGILSYKLFESYEDKILNDYPSVNLGSLYENVVAEELTAHGFDLYYYDNKKKGEVDFLIERGDEIIPLEVKSGKDYKIHSALTNLLSNADLNIKNAYIFSNNNIEVIGKKIYLPIYMIMFFKKTTKKEVELKKVDLSKFKSLANL